MRAKKVQIDLAMAFHVALVGLVACHPGEGSGGSDFHVALEAKSLPDLAELESPKVAVFQNAEGRIIAPLSPFIAITEFHIEEHAALIGRAPSGGLCISVGFERALFMAQMARCSGLYVLDINAAVPLFHRVNGLLLRSAASMEDYVDLRRKAGLEVWKRRLDPRVAGEVESYYRWWDGVVRPAPILLENDNQRLASVNYVRNREAFASLKRLFDGDSPSLRAYLVDLSSRGSLVQGYPEPLDVDARGYTVEASKFAVFVRSLEKARAQNPSLPEVSVVDVSNVFPALSRAAESEPDLRSLYSFLNNLETLVERESFADEDPSPLLTFFAGRAEARVGGTFQVVVDLNSYFRLDDHSAREECLNRLRRRVNAGSDEGSRAIFFSCSETSTPCVQR